MIAVSMARAMAVAERRGAAAAEDRAARLAAAVRAAGVPVVRDGAEVTITGRGVLDDPVLRWPGGLLR